VWLHGGDGSDAPLRARTTDLVGTTVADVELDPSTGAFRSVGRDGVRTRRRGRHHLDDGLRRCAGGSRASVRLADGTPRSGVGALEVHQPCATTWSAGALVVPVLPSDGAVVAQDVADGPPVAVTVAAPQLGARCLVWAADALDGPARGGGLLGTSQAGWTWWWRELLLAATGALALGVGQARRRSGSRPTQDATTAPSGV
jgi:hypothetical protein